MESLTTPKLSVAVNEKVYGSPSTMLVNSALVAIVATGITRVPSAAWPTTLTLVPAGGMANNNTMLALVAVKFCKIGGAGSKKKRKSPLLCPHVQLKRFERPTRFLHLMIFLMPQSLVLIQSKK